MIALTNYRQLPRLISAPNHRTRGSGQRSWTQGWRSQTEGESRKRTEESLLSSGRFRLSPATQCALCLPVLFQQLLRPQGRFFVSFLVRPALLPCGKRGFRAAIYKITRPQPPAAAL